MRGAWIVAAALAVGALHPGAARAGVYFTTGTQVPKFADPNDPDALEPWPWPRADEFLGDLASYRAAAVGGPNHDRYLRRVKELEEKESLGTLSLDDCINLGAYYIRLQQPQKAIRVLEPRAQQSRHFMLRANLATAYELAGGMGDRALTYRQLALSSWPAMYPGWDSAQLNFYRKAEQYHLTLLKLREEEARRQPRVNRLRLDNLFPGVQFVGPTGQYEAGTIAPAQWAEIPADAIDVVMQLLLWLPFDDPLHWQLGELLNARGNVVGAAAIMREVVSKSQGPAAPPDPGKPPSFGKSAEPTRWDAGAPPELREHYRIVSAAAAAMQAYGRAVDQDNFLPLKILAAFAPRGGGLGAGDLIREASWSSLAMVSLERGHRVGPPSGPGPTEGPAAAGPSSSPPGWQPNWRQLGVGFGAGALVTLLLGMQLRQAGRPKG